MSKGIRALVGVALIAVSFLVPVGGLYIGLFGAQLLIGAALEKKPSRVERLQSQSVMVRSAVKPQEILYGRDRKSGVVVWFDTSGSTNEYLWFVIAVVEHEIDGYESLWIDDVEIDLATEIDVSNFVTNTAFIDADGNKLVKTGFYTGASSQTADAELVAAFTEWTTSHNGNDVAYFWIRCELDRSDAGNDPDAAEQNVWAKGWPQDLSVTARGAKVYDPRLDSTQTSIPGAGTHRVDDATTWEWSENSVLCRADYLRSDRFGPGYDHTDIDWDIVAAQADIADEAAALPDSATQDRYTLNGVVTTQDSPKAIVESMQSADHGTTLFLPAGIKVLVGAWDASSHTIDETWLAGPFSATSALATDNAYNGVRGQYLSAADDYTLVEFNPRTSSAYETEDGVGRVWSDIVLPFTSEELRAQRLAIIELKKSRQQVTATLQCNYIAEQVELYQVVTLNLGGFSGDTFRVMGINSSTDGTTTLQLREEVASDWTYTVPELATPPIVPTVTRTADGILPPTNLTATTVVNGILLEWDIQSMAGLSSIWLYASATNDRSVATRLTQTRSGQYLHRLDEGTIRYYWVIARHTFGGMSEWHPVSSTGGVQGTAGGEAAYYYIQTLDGTAIKNGAGSITLVARKITGSTDSVLISGTIKLYDDQDPQQVLGTGYSVTLDADDINGSMLVSLQDGAAGDPLDTMTLTDVYDSAQPQLDPSNPYVVCDIEGFNYPTYGSTYIDGAEGTFRLWVGEEDVTGTVALMYAQDATDGWSAVGSLWKKTLDTGVVIYIDRNTGVYEVKLESTPYYRIWDAVALATKMRVTYNDVIYERLYTLGKVRSGRSESVYIKIPGVSAYAASPDTESSAAVKFDNDGYIYTKENDGSWVQGNQWLLAGTNSEYSVRAVLSSEAGSTHTISGTFNSFLDLATDRAWSITTTGGNIQLISIAFEIQRDSTSNVLYEGGCVLEAEFSVT